MNCVVYKTMDTKLILCVKANKSVIAGITLIINVANYNNVFTLMLTILHSWKTTVSIAI